MQFVQTNMGEQVNRVLVDALGGFLKVEDVVNGKLFLTQLSCTFTPFAHQCRMYFGREKSSKVDLDSISLKYILPIVIKSTPSKNYFEYKSILVQLLYTDK